MENIVLYSSKFFLSESETNPEAYIGKFAICDFSYNGNNIGLNRDTIENWMPTLVNFPLVGKIKMRSDGEYDFTGHNMKKIKRFDENGNEYTEYIFDTDAFGTFVSVNIEEIDGVEYIVATAYIWKRFKNACEIILKRAEEGTLHTSWEITVLDETKKVENGKVKRLINSGRFFGHCLLGKNVTPAYQSSGLLEIASTENNEDDELNYALSQDIINNLNDSAEKGKEDGLLEGELNVNENAQTENQVTAENNNNNENDNLATINASTGENTNNNNQENETQTASLTDWDLRRKIGDACRQKTGKWCWVAYHFPVEKTVWVEPDMRESELDYLLFTYEVENDVVTVSDPQEVKLTVSIAEVNSTIASLNAEISSKDDAIIKAGEEIKNLNAQVSELKPYKAHFDDEEQKRISAENEQKKDELRKKIVGYGYITNAELDVENSEIKGYLDALDEKSLRKITSERIMAELDKNKNENNNENIVTSTSTANTGKDVASLNLSNNDDESYDVKTDASKIIGKYLKGGKK